MNPPIKLDAFLKEKSVYRRFPSLYFLKDIIIESIFINYYCYDC